MNKQLLLQVDDLVIGYSKNKPLCQASSFAIYCGEVTVILGRNGQGKTTLMKTLLGLIKPQAGSVTRFAEIAYVPHSFTLPFDYQVDDVVMMGRAQKIRLFSQPTKQDKQIVSQALQQLGISDLSDCYFQQLSGGQQQLVMIARALATQAKIIILDEPTSALDLSRQGKILALLKKLAKQQELAIVFASHDPTHGHLIADNALFMLPKGELHYAAADKLFTTEYLTKLYGVPMQSIPFEYGQLHIADFSRFGFKRRL